MSRRSSASASSSLRRHACTLLNVPLPCSSFTLFFLSRRCFLSFTRSTVDASSVLALGWRTVVRAWPVRSGSPLRFYASHPSLYTSTHTHATVHRIVLRHGYASAPYPQHTPPATYRKDPGITKTLQCCGSHVSKQGAKFVHSFVRSFT